MEKKTEDFNKNHTKTWSVSYSISDEKIKKMYIELYKKFNQKDYDDFAKIVKYRDMCDKVIEMSRNNDLYGFSYSLKGTKGTDGEIVMRSNNMIVEAQLNDNNILFTLKPSYEISKNIDNIYSEIEICKKEAEKKHIDYDYINKENLKTVSKSGNFIGMIFLPVEIIKEKIKGVITAIRRKNVKIDKILTDIEMLFCRAKTIEDQFDCYYKSAEEKISEAVKAPKVFTYNQNNLSLEDKINSFENQIEVNEVELCNER